MPSPRQPHRSPSPLDYTPGLQELMLKTESLRPNVVRVVCVLGIFLASLAVLGWNRVRWALRQARETWQVMDKLELPFSLKVLKLDYPSPVEVLQFLLFSATAVAGLLFLLAHATKLLNLAIAAQT